MTKKNFTDEDVEKLLVNNPEFEKVSGTYVLSRNSISLGDTSNHSNFSCEEKDFNFFVEQIMEALQKLSTQPAAAGTLEWAPLPGVNREKLEKRFLAPPLLHRRLILEDPNVLLIQKAADDGHTINWKTPDGRIGSGGLMI